MKKLLILSLLFLFVGCSEKSSKKNIDLVCDGTYSDKSKSNFTLHINGNEGKLSESPLKCEWINTSVKCEDDLKTITIDRYSLVYHMVSSSKLSLDGVFFMSDGKCKLVERQI